MVNGFGIIDLLLLSGGSALFSVIAVGAVRRYALRHLIDVPNDRSSHEVPTPRGGGLGIIIAIAVAWVIASVWLVDEPLHRSLYLIACVVAMSALGWIDDHRSLSSRVRFGIQALIIAYAIYVVGLPDPCVLFGFPLPLVGWWLLPLAVVSSLWLVNLFNFMDGIDGIAGSQAIVASCGLFLLIGAADPAISVGMIAAVGACAGFLVWNWPRAKIFMGDVGSTGLGMVLVIGVITALKEQVSTELTAMCLLPFVWDATATVLRRGWQREGIFDAHRTHLYQRLSRHWGSHACVSLLYAVLAAVSVSLAAFSAHGARWLGVDYSSSWLHPAFVLGYALAPLIVLTVWARHVR